MIVSIPPEIQNLHLYFNLTCSHIEPRALWGQCERDAMRVAGGIAPATVRGWGRVRGEALEEGGGGGWRRALAAAGLPARATRLSANGSMQNDGGDLGRGEASLLCVCVCVRGLV